MSNFNTVVERFWAYSVRSPNNPALLIKNPHIEAIATAMSHAYLHPYMSSSLLRPYVDITYRHMSVAVAAIAAVLHNNGFRKGERAAILAWNCPEWVIADLAIQSLGGVTVPIYPHSTPEQVNYVINDAEARYIFSNEQSQLDKVDSATGCVPLLFDAIPEQLTKRANSSQQPFAEYFTQNSMQYSLNSQALEKAASKQLESFRSRLLNRDFDFDASDLATIIYTSGSTGVPKGVMLTHRAFAAACQGILAHGFNLDARKDRYLSYLPLAHVYERAAGEMLCLWTGVPMAFCRVEEVGETAKTVRPTILHGVPAVWRKVKDKVDANLAASDGIKKKLADWAFTQQNSTGIKHFLADKLVFAKIRAELGGRVRICTSGGAPISEDILQFYQGIGINLLQGYGLTESTGATAVNRADGVGSGNKIGSVGQFLETTSARIASLTGAENSDEGEIQLFGPTITAGYWNLPEETARTFTEDGWFKTGDKGRIDSDGCLYITGRIKRLLKTDGGKYVSPEKIEKCFEGDAIVQCVVPVGDGKPFISGLLFLNQEIAAERLRKANVHVPEEITAAFFAEHPVIQEAVSKAVTAANSKLERWETLKKWHIVDAEATIADGLLTPTLKIRTEEVLRRYSKEIASFYEK